MGKRFLGSKAGKMFIYLFRRCAYFSKGAEKKIHNYKFSEVNVLREGKSVPYFN